MNMKHSIAALTFVFTLSLLLPASVNAENWPHWRGPAYDGSSPEKNLPAKFSKTKNIKWQVALPGANASTPIIFDDNVFVSSIDKENRLLAICFDRKSGKERWSKVVGVSAPFDRRATKAAPSPVTDGKTVVYFYGSGDLVGYSVDGEKLWDRNVVKDYGDFCFQWTFAASPTFWKGAVYLPVLQRNSPVHGRGKANAESFILKIDPANGKTLVKHIRPSKAKAESLESFTSLIPYKGQLVLAGGDCLTGHDPATLKEQWRWGTWNPTRIGHWRLVPSAAVGGGVIIACAPKGDPIYAISDALKGDHSSTKPLWKSDDNRDLSSDVCTPAFYDGKFYVQHDKRRVLSCVEPKTGKVIWKERLEGRSLVRASPTVADGKVYVQDHDGTVFVLDAKSGKVLNRTNMATESVKVARPSIAVSQGNLFIKVGKALYCVGSDQVN
jgi:outer membrane protein assembly factor BamB